VQQFKIYDDESGVHRITRYGRPPQGGRKTAGLVTTILTVAAVVALYGLVLLMVLGVVSF